MHGCCHALGQATVGHRCICSYICAVHGSKLQAQMRRVERLMQRRWCPVQPCQCWHVPKGSAASQLQPSYSCPVQQAAMKHGSPQCAAMKHGKRQCKGQHTKERLGTCRYSVQRTRASAANPIMCRLRCSNLLVASVWNSASCTQQ